MSPDGGLSVIAIFPFVLDDAGDLNRASALVGADNSPELGHARQLNLERFHLPEIGASDAHFLEATGASHTVFEGSTADDLRNAIVAGATRAVAGPYPSMLELGILNVARQQWRGLMATPRQMGWLPIIKSFLWRVKP